MKQIKRDMYLNQLIDSKENNMIKVITGIRRCGKSYLLFNLYYDYLLSIGILPDNIIKIALEDDANEHLRNTKALRAHIKDQVKNGEKYYVFLDEIQFIEDFEGLLNGLNKSLNLDIYVTGSNSKFLSTDIITEFRGRSDEIRVHPLSFREYYYWQEEETLDFITADGKTLITKDNKKFVVKKYSVEEIWQNYFTYGGLPEILTLKTDLQKRKYLNMLFEKTYITDIIDRNNLQKNNVLETIINVLASSVGSLTNPLKLAKTFTSTGIKGVSDKTISAYINYLIEAFMINKVERYDVKGKKYISTPSKYYFSDVGLRNVRLNFRQQEENHIMENIIYNELLIRGYNVDVGVVEQWTTDSKGKRTKKQLEVDFVCNQGSKRYYIQSALSIPDKEKMNQEQNSLIHIDDSFKKIVVVKDNIKLWRNDQGIVIIGLQEFLL